MARIKKGEMTLLEIKNLVRQHNKLTAISLTKKSRADLIEEIENMGYVLNHNNKSIVKKRVRKNNKVLKVGDQGDSASQRKKKEKQKKKDMLKKGGSAPVYVKDRGEDEI